MSNVKALMSIAIHTLRSGVPTDFPASLPVYAVPQSAVPWHSPKGLIKGSVAHTGQDVDLRVSPFLSASGQWQGRGFAFVYDDNGPVLSSLAGIQDLPVALGVLLHEAGHYLEYQSSPLRMESQAIRQYAKELVNDHEIQRYFGTDHGLLFVRATIHMWYRCQFQAFDLSDCLCAGERYRMSDPNLYKFALASELASRRHEPITSILRSRPPTAAMELFESDLKRRGHHVFT